MDTVTFTLEPLPPFRLDLTVWVLRRRPDNLLDLWDGDVYRRALFLRDRVAVVTVRQAGTVASPLLHVTLSAPRPASDLVEEAGGTLTRMLGLRTDLAGLYELAARDRKLKELVARFRGVKPPRFPTLFEGLANAVACQQLTLTFGIQLLNRLVRTFGPPLSADEDAPRAFPCPEDVKGLDPEAFRALGFSRQKGRTLVDLARSIAAGGLDPEELEALGDDAAVRRLCSLRGIGRWSAEYLLLRTLGRTNVFPGDDVGGRKNLERWLQLHEPLDYQGVEKIMAGWRGYGGLIYFHLLLDRLAAAGYLS